MKQASEGKRRWWEVQEGGKRSKVEGDKWKGKRERNEREGTMLDMEERMT